MVRQPEVEVKAWNQREALAVVDGVRVRVERRVRTVRWRCQACGPQVNRPTCRHTLALASTPIPETPNRKESS